MVNQDTLDWWERQSPEARKVLDEAADPETATPLADALAMFSEYLPKGMPIWSNGANFDQPLLDVAYNRCEILLPWKYWSSRCYRTIKALHPSPKSVEPPKICAHNALEDAKWQARHLVAMARGLRITL